MTASIQLAPFEQNAYDNGDDNTKAELLAARLSMTSPPPPYHSVVHHTSANQLMYTMNRAMSDTQTMLKEINSRFSSRGSTNRLLAKSTEPVEELDVKDDTDMDESLRRISDSLQQLINEAQTGLKKGIPRHAVHRAKSSPQLKRLQDVSSPLLDEDTDSMQEESDDEIQPAKRHPMARASTNFESWRQQNERYVQSENRLDLAMERLIETVQRMPQKEKPRKSRKPRPRSLHHHIHSHYHIHQEQPVPPLPSRPVSTYALLSSIRSFIPSKLASTKTSSEPSTSHTPYREQTVHQPSPPPSASSPPPQKPKQQTPLRLTLQQPLLRKSLFYATLLLYRNFLSIRQRNDRSLWYLNLLAKPTKMRMQKPQSTRQWTAFFATAPPSLSLSTWLERATFLVYILRFISLQRT